MFNTGSPFGGGFDIMFTVVPIIIAIGFVIVIAGVVMNGMRYYKNAKAPRQSEFATVVAKRMEVRSNTNHHNNGSDGMHVVNSSRTYYYITLEFDNGSRKEYLDVKNLYGLVVEGDIGFAAVQGDWIVAFERDGA